MKATDVLTHEHRAIEIVLDGFDKASRLLEEGEHVDLSLMADCLDFATGFADRCHHAKEEQELFKVLEARGISSEGGPIGVMLHDHDEGRHLLKCIGKDLDKLTQGDHSARQPLAEAMKCYAALMRNHIAKEDQVLFVLASRVLTDEDDEKLVDAFERLEETQIGHAVHERYHRMLDDLKERIDRLPG